MPSCELCGQDTDSVTEVKIEGARMKVCDSCAEMGEEVKTGSQKKKKRKKRSSGGRSQQVLVDGYGQQIKQARESEGISIKELADELNEKSSLISKLEKEQLKPDKSLAGKLSDRLDVDLYTNPQVNDYDTSDGSDSRKATVGDVAQVDD
ncbi:MAG: multiprotein bridging factor aMBF1 [Candidatus Nanohaloarchaea archaeon]